EGLKPASLSGGMRKRVGLARAIAYNPEIILYDEPTTGIDPVMGAAIDRLIKKLQEELSHTAVVVTHDMASAYRIADRIAMLHQGKIIALGTPEQIRESKDPIVRQFVRGEAEGPLTKAG
ncbi:ATP-binding cassette domain-containing protein, partial [bacterium]|nr:ATP-binding cassette domain-containing protein [bacterium]